MSVPHSVKCVEDEYRKSSLAYRLLIAHLLQRIAGEKISKLRIKLNFLAKSNLSTYSQKQDENDLTLPRFSLVACLGFCRG